MSGFHRVVGGIVPPSSWGGGNITDDIFDCLVEDIQPNDTKAWPATVRELLVKIRDAEIQDCPGLDQLVETLNDPSRYTADENNKSAPARAIVTAPGAPADEHREMKQMFSSAPAARVLQLPQPFREVVQNSMLWKWEGGQGRGTTGTMATLFPKDATQDVSFTIRCGHNDGYRLNDTYGFKLAFSS
ncbi:hypothetical protein CDV36_006605 [Fusarium kuroshium]|uniref:Uncharacterized protein n=1 Tax=Fusarium kuroshium TaxID=2010991 RepID=A0A3M2S7Z6_9HYPO|nr:hypothetical protein CDV36_006605 [Fusarium kuroshium]